MRALKTTALGALIAAGLALSAPALAADDAATQDVKCLAVSLALSGMKDDPELAQAGLMSTLYFAGKVEGRNPKADAMDLAAAALDKMSVEESQQQAIRCGQILAEKGKAWEAKGKAMEAAGR